MKIDRLETHDRLKQFQSEWEALSQGVEDCIYNVPDEVKCPFYVWGHSRQINLDEKFDLFFKGGFKYMEEVPSERMIWMPRITKPLAEPNSYLFRARKGTDLVEIIWLLPKRELWEQFEPGKMTYNEDVWNSIQNYKHARAELEMPDSDITLEEINEFKRIIRMTAEWNLKDEPFRMI